MKHVLLAAVLVLAGAASYAQLEGTFAGVTDVGTAGGSIEAEVVKNSTHDPWHAYEDVDGDGLFTEGTDVKLDDAEILDGTYTVSKAQHGLVIPKSVGPVDVDGPIRFEAGQQGHLTVEVRLTASAGISLVAGHEAQLDGLVADAGGAITIEVGSVAHLENAYLRTDEGEVSILADDGIDGYETRIEAEQDITLDAKRGAIGLVGASIHTGGALVVDDQQGLVNADRSNLAAEERLTITSGNDVRVKQATLSTPEDIVLTAGKHKDTIFVQDARFQDANDVAKAAPDRVEIVGTPAEGRITHEG